MLGLNFVDGMQHYDQAGLPLMWAVPSYVVPAPSNIGTVDTNPAHARTGTQSIRLQAGDAPVKQFSGLGNAVVGFGWRTESLAGETIFELWNYLSTGGLPERQLFFVQNANGSISLWSDPGPTLLATSAAGVLTTNAYYYLEIYTQLLTGYILPVQCFLTVTPDATGTATQVINETGFTTTQSSWDTLIFVGPSGADFANIADFYEQDSWDGLDDPLAILGAPKWYMGVPIADGLDYVAVFVPAQTVYWNGTAAPWFSQVNIVPEQTATYVYRFDNGMPLPDISGWPYGGLTYSLDVSAIPPGSSLCGVAVVALLAAAAADASLPDAEVSILTGWSNFKGSPANTARNLGSGLVQYDISPGDPPVPFAYKVTGSTQNPLTLAAWQLSEFTGPTAVQLGTITQEPA